MDDTIFTKIIKGEIPCHKVFEDDKTFAFLDIHPVQPGQVLVIPKAQVALVWDLPQEDYYALMTTAQKVALRLREVFPDKARIAMHVEGLDVAHAHLKLFPFDTGDEFRRKPDADPVANEALAKLAQALAF